MWNGFLVSWPHPSASEIPHISRLWCRSPERRNQLVIWLHLKKWHFQLLFADDKVLNQNEGEGCKVSAFRKVIFHVRKKHVFRGMVVSLLTRIDSWSTVGLMILPHQSQPIRKTPTCSSVTWPLNAELKPITSSTNISKFWGVSTRAWFGKPGATPECHLASCSQGTAKTCCVWGWLLAQISRELYSHTTGGLILWGLWHILGI